MKKRFTAIMLMAAILTSCGGNEWPSGEEPFGPYPGQVDPGSGTASTADTTITPYGGARATDAAMDEVGTSEDLFWERNSFTSTVMVTYNGTEATVSNTDVKIATYVSGADVTVDMLTNSVKGVEIIVKGKSDGSEGIESKANLNISGGTIYVYAYDDAINAAKSINISGGKTYAYAVNNDGIDSNGTLTITGGLVLGHGTAVPEEGLDSDFSNRFTINGGTVIGTGGAATDPSSSSKQYSLVYGGISIAMDSYITITDDSGKPITTVQLPRTLNQGLCLSSAAPTSRRGRPTTSRPEGPSQAPPTSGTAGARVEPGAAAAS